MPERIQRKRAKDPRPGSVTRPCYQCGVHRAKPGQNGYCGPGCRFWSKVDKTGECWLWTGARHNSKGYGRFNADGLRWLAHRFAYTMIVGPFPNELELDHTCHNTRCVNPNHLDPVTSEVHDNERTDQGAYNRAKTECPHGHRYTPENTRVDKNGRRHCRDCGRGRYATANSAA